MIDGAEGPTAGRSETPEVELSSGSYVLFCNIAEIEERAVHSHLQAIAVFPRSCFRLTEATPNGRVAPAPHLGCL